MEVQSVAVECLPLLCMDWQLDVCREKILHSSSKRQKKVMENLENLDIPRGYIWLQTEALLLLFLLLEMVYLRIAVASAGQQKNQS